MKCTKIVATLGPGSNTPDTIEQLLQAGADVIRLNFSHGRHDDHAQSVQPATQMLESMIHHPRRGQ